MESIIEAISNEVLDLKPCVQRNNLISHCNDLYRQWEDMQDYEKEYKRLQSENEILRKLLFETLSSEDRLYIRIKYDIEV